MTDFKFNFTSEFRSTMKAFYNKNIKEFDKHYNNILNEFLEYGELHTYRALHLLNSLRNKLNNNNNNNNNTFKKLFLYGFILSIFFSIVFLDHAFILPATIMLGFYLLTK